MRTLFYCILISFLGISCNKTEDASLPDLSMNFTFEDGFQGWIAGMSDFPSHWDPAGLEFSSEHASLPAEMDHEGKAIKLSGRNISDDMFMFLKREISGLKANHTYSVLFDIQIASQYPTESFGIGGSPGNSVYLKAGGSKIEPMVIDEDGMFLINIDKGDQSQEGNDMKVLGTIGIPGEEFIYTLINRTNSDKPIQITTDEAGKLWVIIGTDSGFEGITTLYYNNINITLEE